MFDLTPEMVLRAYACGLFPMADGRHDRDIYWVDPEVRGIIPLDRFHVSRRLARRVRSGYFEVRVDTAFAEVIRGCAAETRGRRETWINDDIIALYCALHEIGHAHSVECWREGVLEGGLYGVTLGGAFFGESMFSRARDASKVALVHLVERLQRGGFQLLDTQFVTTHLQSFGTIEVPRTRYHNLLRAAINVAASFYPDDGAGGAGISGSAAGRQSRTQMS